MLVAVVGRIDEPGHRTAIEALALEPVGNDAAVPGLLEKRIAYAQETGRLKKS